MIYRFVPHRTLSDTATCIKLESIPADDIVCERTAVDRRHKFDLLFGNFQGGRNRGITAIGKECCRFNPRFAETFDDGKGFADIRPTRAMHFIVGYDFRLFGIIAGLGDVKTVSRTLVPVRCVRIILFEKGITSHNYVTPFSILPISVLTS